MNESNARSQAESQLESIRAMVAALDCDYERLQELHDELADLKSDLDGGTQENINVLEQWQIDYADELAELEAAAGECENRDDAERRIQDDALSVEVRSDWHAPGGNADNVEFRIVLCTGGPHVQIRGELDENEEPKRAWLEYQDWGTPMTEKANNPGDQDLLLSYARCFYFVD